MRGFWTKYMMDGFHLKCPQFFKYYNSEFYIFCLILGTWKSNDENMNCGLVGKWLYDHYLKLMNNCVR